MNIKDLLHLLSLPTSHNYCVICADDLGLGLLLNGALASIANSEDIHFHDAGGLTKEKARQIEVEARYAPRGSSKLTHFYIFGLQRLPVDSTGPLLKAVEEAKYARFIFQTQSLPRKILTLMSRSTVVRLPFLSRRVVLGNMEAMNHDARTADELDLYDGTLAGTIKALGSKDTALSIKRFLDQSERGLLGIFAPEILGSMVFERTVYPTLTGSERAFLRREKTEARQKLALYHSFRRKEYE